MFASESVRQSVSPCLQTGFGGLSLWLGAVGDIQQINRSNLGAVPPLSANSIRNNHDDDELKDGD